MQIQQAMRGLILGLATGTLCGFSPNQARCQTVDLLLRYPARMIEGDTAPDRARPWTFSDADVFRLSQFSLDVGTELRVKIEAADVGIGHCVDGAVWAVLMPRAE